MADRVRVLQEEMIPEVEALEEIGLFTKVGVFGHVCCRVCNVITSDKRCAFEGLFCVWQSLYCVR